MKKLFSKYHKGERLAQENAGEIREAEFNSQAINNEIIEGAINFIGEQEYAVVSIEDDSNNIWSSIITGEKSFIHARDKKTLIIDLTKTYFVEQDRFWRSVNQNKNIGMVIIELASRRRLRVNGLIKIINKKEIIIKVKEAYPNCMKYIQRRHIVERATNTNQLVSSGEQLGEEQLSIITNADTFFIGTSNPNGNLDVSHRGGKPGFVEVKDRKSLKVPDYKGNSMFNTFGNLMLNDKAGLVFWDFNQSQLLQLNGNAVINWNSPGNEEKTAGTNRFWEFKINEWIQISLVKKYSWEFLDYSPNNPK